MIARGLGKSGLRSTLVVSFLAVPCGVLTVIGVSPLAYTDCAQSSGYGENRMEQILQSHIVVPKYLRLDNFETFFKARENALLDRIEQAMGKPIARAAVPQDFDTVEEEPEIEE